MSYYVYLMANRKNGVLYTGVTRDLIKRVYEHRESNVEGFTKKYGVKNLVYFEASDSIDSAIERERRIKKWNREWKIRLINKNNPNWDDLYEKLIQGSPAKASGDDRLRSSI